VRTILLVLEMALGRAATAVKIVNGHFGASVPVEGLYRALGEKINFGSKFENWSWQGNQISTLAL
jgi:hypothetical protein